MYSQDAHFTFSGVGGSGIWIYSQDEDQAHFTWENTTISPGLAGVAFQFTVKMKPRRTLNEKTQRFLRGGRECTRTFHANLELKWRPGAFYMRKRNDFSAVGGGLRRGCILIRNRDGWGIDSIRFPLPFALSKSWKDGGGVKFLHIKRK